MRPPGAVTQSTALHTAPPACRSRRHTRQRTGSGPGIPPTPGGIDFRSPATAQLRRARHRRSGHRQAGPAGCARLAVLATARLALPGLLGLPVLSAATGVAAISATSAPAPARPRSVCRRDRLCPKLRTSPSNRSESMIMPSMRMYRRAHAPGLRNTPLRPEALGPSSRRRRSATSAHRMLSCLRPLQHTVLWSNVKTRRYGVCGQS